MLNNILKRDLVLKGDCKVIWNEAKECMSRDELETLQSARLVKQVNRVYHNVPYYRKKMQEVGLERYLLGLLAILAL